MSSCFSDILPPPKDYKAPQIQHEEMSVKEIMTRKVCILVQIVRYLVFTSQKDDDNTALIALLRDYLETLDLDPDSRSRLGQYLDY